MPYRIAPGRKSTNPPSPPPPPPPFYIYSASLPSKGIITSNYDQLAETAYANVNLVRREKNQLFSVIPYLPVKGAKRWLLKMHGCVSAVNDIIITSEDYRKSAASKRALGGIVQANLLTSHMVFVGFSMTDPNYVRIIEEVRDALRPASGGEAAAVATTATETATSTPTTAATATRTTATTTAKAPAPTTALPSPTPKHS